MSRTPVWLNPGICPLPTRGWLQPSSSGGLGAPPGQACSHRAFSYPPSLRLSPPKLPQGFICLDSKLVVKGQTQLRDLLGELPNTGCPSGTNHPEATSAEGPFCPMALLYRQGNCDPERGEAISRPQSQALRAEPGLEPKRMGLLSPASLPTAPRAVGAPAFPGSLPACQSRSLHCLVSSFVS